MQLLTGRQQSALLSAKLLTVCMKNDIMIVRKRKPPLSARAARRSSICQSLKDRTEHCIFAMTQFEQAKKLGFTTIYTDTAESVERQIEAYNRQMTECRFKKKRLRQIEEGYFILNIVLVGVITAVQLDVLIEHPLFFAAAAAIWAICFVLLGFVNAKPAVTTAAVIPLAVLDPRFFILFAADVILAAVQYRLGKNLKLRQGYPAFTDILIKKVRRYSHAAEALKDFLQYPLSYHQ